MSRRDFAGILRRWFFADEMTAAEIARLYAQWLELAASDARLRGQDLLFDPRNRIAVGSDWWEQRQLGRSETLWPGDPEARVKMFLTSEGPPAGPMPRPRPYCPEQLVGQWRCTGRVARFGSPPVPVDGTREWWLRSDGGLEAAEDPTRDGGKWWAQQGLEPDALDVYIAPRSRLAPECWRVVDLRGGEMDLAGPETPTGFLRWARVEAGRGY